MQFRAVLMEELTELKFNKSIVWDIGTLSKDFAYWLTADDGKPADTS